MLLKPLTNYINIVYTEVLHFTFKHDFKKILYMVSDIYKHYCSKYVFAYINNVLTPDDHMSMTGVQI